VSGALLPWLVVASSLVPGLVIFLLPNRARITRSTLNLAAAVLKLGLVGWLLGLSARGEFPESRLPFLPGGLDLVLRVDAPALLFATLSSVLWLVTTVYAIAYLEAGPHRSRFFGFFSLVVASTMGVALAGNLVTFLVFYEALTLSTWPLVVHDGTPKAFAAGRRYLAYTLGGSAALLVGVALLHATAGPFDFAHLGALSDKGLPTGTLRVAFLLLGVGFGVKAALVPLHGWLPGAMVAPAPVSALLHAVAVVKAGAFGIVRLVYDVYGIEFSASIGVLPPLAVLAAITILFGSWRALAQDDLKRRLAYSTVSQVSYIVLGTAIVGESATLGGLVHLVHQGIMKITLFLCAGIYARTLGVHKVSELAGVGRRMPLATAAFSIGALGMIGVPPLAGFVSKWYLALGAMEGGAGWAVWVLAASALLNAAYFLPILRDAWFVPQRGRWPREHRFGSRLETSPGLLFPAIFTAALVVLSGVLAATDWSPLSWARLIVGREYAE